MEHWSVGEMRLISIAGRAESECLMANEAFHVPAPPMVTQRSSTLKDVPCDQQERIVASELDLQPLQASELLPNHTWRPGTWAGG